jgi:hypothetical protein
VEADQLMRALAGCLFLALSACGVQQRVTLLTVEATVECVGGCPNDQPIRRPHCGFDIDEIPDGGVATVWASPHRLTGVVVLNTAVAGAQAIQRRAALVPTARVSSAFASTLNGALFGFEGTPLYDIEADGTMVLVDGGVRLSQSAHFDYPIALPDGGNVMVSEQHRVAERGELLADVQDPGDRGCCSVIGPGNVLVALSLLLLVRRQRTRTSAHPPTKAQQKRGAYATVGGSTLRRSVSRREGGPLVETRFVLVPHGSEAVNGS